MPTNRRSETRLLLAFDCRPTAGRSRDALVTLFTF